MKGEAAKPLECPYCGAYEVDRLYLGTARVDACTCSNCGARWDQDAITGEYRGRSSLPFSRGRRGRPPTPLPGA